MPPPPRLPALLLAPLARTVVLAAVLTGTLALSACTSARAPVAATASAAPPDAMRAAADIRAVLDAQVRAWNAGDIPGFMDGYWRSDALRFASGGTVRRGWQATLDGYVRGYPDRAAMGTLDFSGLDVDVLSPTAATVFGRWRLTFESGAAPAGGLFTLGLRRIDLSTGALVTGALVTGAPAAPPGGGTAWRVVSDHTSSDR